MTACVRGRPRQISSLHSRIERVVVLHGPLTRSDLFLFFGEGERRTVRRQLSMLASWGRISLDGDVATSGPYSFDENTALVHECLWLELGIACESLTEEQIEERVHFRSTGYVLSLLAARGQVALMGRDDDHEVIWGPPTQVAP